jgi:hypothetical protein
VRETGQDSYEQMARARERLLERLHPLPHRHADKKRTEIARAIAPQLEAEGQFPRPSPLLIMAYSPST